MKKILFFIILLSISLSSQNITYSDWKEESLTHMQLLPKYGNDPKMLKTEKLLLITYGNKTGKNHSELSEFLINTGFTYITQGNFKTAMHRFNQAWILNPKNENVFWGFGTIYFNFMDYEMAIEQYGEGLQINPLNSNILTDKASFYLAKFSIDRNNENLDEALSLLNQAYSVDNKNPAILFKLSAGYFLKQDCEKSLQFLTESDSLDKNELVSNEFRTLVFKRCLQ